LEQQEVKLATIGIDLRTLIADLAAMWSGKPCITTESGLGHIGPEFHLLERLDNLAQVYYGHQLSKSLDLKIKCTKQPRHFISTPRRFQDTQRRATQRSGSETVEIPTNVDERLRFLQQEIISVQSRMNANIAEWVKVNFRAGVNAKYLR
jgi:hypothetical protein